jgi:DNA modification methylase
MSSKLIHEMLSEVNADVKLFDTKYKTATGLKIILQYAFDPEKKFDLPETDPPYKKDLSPAGMAPTTLIHEAKRLYVFLRKDLTKIKREQLFIDLLESIEDEEAAVLLAVKDQKLTKLYPKITKKLVKDLGIV